LNLIQLKKAIELDSTSIKLCLELVLSLFDKFLEFDYRNGPLRRKFDGVKYVCKTLQNICYDLSIASFKKNKNEEVDKKLEEKYDVKLRFDETEIDEIRKRLDEYDLKREEIIKTCRDAQKASKQAIFSVHRNQAIQAEIQIEKASKVLKSLLPIIEKEPTLRHGSFSNACEEYAEAVLFYCWMFKPDRPLLLRNEILIVTHEEYLGGLVDFTGEVGRYAVVMATNRQKETVIQCINVSVLIRQTLDSSKKLRLKGDKSNALRTNCKKLQTLLYELTIAEYSGKSSSVVVEYVKDGKETEIMDEEETL